MKNSYRAALILLSMLSFFISSIGAVHIDTLYCLQGNSGSMSLTQSMGNSVLHDDEYYYSGKYWDWSYMIKVASYPMLSFTNTPAPLGFSMVAATLRVYIVQSYGDSQAGVYPSFEIGGEIINPHCQIIHKDFGVSLSALDHDAPALHPPLNFFNSFIQGWNDLDVSTFVLDNIANARAFHQFAMPLEYLSDWQAGDDFLMIAGAIGNYPPQLIVEYSTPSALEDVVGIQTQLKAWPNPFKNSISLDFGKPLQETAQIDVFNARGQRLVSLTADSGKNSVTWNGIDGVGRTCPPGIYILKVTQAKSQKTIKVVRIP